MLAVPANTFHRVLQCENCEKNNWGWQIGLPSHPLPMPFVFHPYFPHHVLPLPFPPFPSSYARIADLNLPDPLASRNARLSGQTEEQTRHSVPQTDRQATYVRGRKSVRAETQPDRKNIYHSSTLSNTVATEQHFKVLYTVVQ